MADAEDQKVRLSSFDNAWYSPGRSVPVRVAWMVANEAFLRSGLPWPSSLKRRLLRLFGAKVGERVVIRHRINVKYPWNLEVGDDAWIGEGVWIDSLARVAIGANACVSQGCMIETGNHDWSDPAFGLMVQPVVIEDGAWAAVKSVLLPGSRLASHAVLGGGAVLAGETEPYGIYVGNPAKKVKRRQIGQKKAPGRSRGGRASARNGKA